MSSCFFYCIILCNFWAYLGYWRRSISLSIYRKEMIFLAKRRCISIDFYDSDAFCRLSAQSRVLYTELILHSDDDGVVINPKAAMTICKAKAKNLEELMQSRFLILIDGVYIVRHWYVHNKVQPSRKVDSIYGETLLKLYVNDRGEYCPFADNLSTNCRPNITKPNLTKYNSSELKSNKMNLTKENTTEASGKDADNCHFSSLDGDGDNECLKRYHEAIERLRDGGYIK